MARVNIQGNIGTMLTYLGSLYRNPAEAIKEYVSNALDKWNELSKAGSVTGPCHVRFRLQRRKVIIEYNAPGMDEGEFREALQRVADSSKRTLSVPQIGQLGIGIFAFNQIGDTATFYSKKGSDSPTVKVTLRKDEDAAEIDQADSDEALDSPGMKIAIEGVTSDPTKARKPLGWERLSAYFADKFDSHLRSSRLKLEIRWGRRSLQVKPKPIALPKLLGGRLEAACKEDPRDKVQLELYFDEACTGEVAVRHSGVVVIDSVKNYPGYGLEDSVFSSGFVQGYIAADFLKPLVARAGFADDSQWKAFLLVLDTIHPELQQEVERLREKARQRNLTQIQKKAVRLASEILRQDTFKDLELLAGMRKPREKQAKPSSEKKKVIDKFKELFRRQPPEPGTRKGGIRISYREDPFPDGPARHSDFTAGTVTANTKNPDYQALDSAEGKLTYAALLIGKETIAFDDKSGRSNEALEKMLSYLFAVQQKVRTSPKSAAKSTKLKTRRRKKAHGRARRAKGRRGRKKTAQAVQPRLPL